MNQRNRLWCLAALMLVLGVQGCGDDDDESTTPPGDTAVVDTTTPDVSAPDTNQPPGPGPGAFQADFETSAEFFTTFTDWVDTQSPHVSVKIWYSTNIQSLFGQSSFTVPAGTVAIKAFDMDKNGALDGYAVMVKKEAGFDATHNDWHYEMRDDQGNLLQVPPPGKIEDCINCHQGWSATDYLAGTNLP